LVVGWQRHKHSHRKPPNNWVWCWNQLQDPTLSTSEVPSINVLLQQLTHCNPWCNSHEVP
jgi:hypothetical protein